MVDFGDALSKGAKFCIDLKRWLPLFVLDMAVAFAALAVLFINSGILIQELIESAAHQAASQIGTIVLMKYVGFMFLVAAWLLLRLWITSALIHQSYRSKEVRKSFIVAASRLHKIIFAALIVGLLTSLLGMIPFAGFIIVIIASLAFFFVYQGIMVENLGAISALKNSWKIFRKEPLNVFLSMLLVSIVSFFIIAMFALPFLLYLIMFILYPLLSGSSGSIALALVYFQRSPATFIALGTIALIGLSLSTAFSLKAQTELYLQFRKRNPSIIRSLKDKIGRFF